MKKVTYYIQKNIDKYEFTTYIIMQRTKVDKGFMIETYNDEIYTDENKAKSKLNLINYLNKGV